MSIFLSLNSTETTAEPPRPQRLKAKPPTSVRFKPPSQHVGTAPVHSAPATPPRRGHNAAAPRGRDGKAGAQRGNGLNASPENASDTECLLISLKFQDGQGQSEHGGGDAEKHACASAAGDLAEMEAEELMKLMPTEGNSGIFEILMPGNEWMGVVVDIFKGSASFLMTPRSEKLYQLISARKMELERALTRRMERPVTLTLL